MSNPEMHKVLDPITDQLNTTIAQKLTATDQLMRENISKLVKSKVPRIVLECKCVSVGVSVSF